MNTTTKPVTKAEYHAYCSQVAQASWDRWPEAHAMTRRLFAMADELGIDTRQVTIDIANAPCERDGGRW